MSSKVTSVYIRTYEQHYFAGSGCDNLSPAGSYERMPASESSFRNLLAARLTQRRARANCHPDRENKWMVTDSQKRIPFRSLRRAHAIAAAKNHTHAARSKKQCGRRPWCHGREGFPQAELYPRGKAARQKAPSRPEEPLRGLLRNTHR